MNISLLSIFFGLLLFAFPIFILIRFRLNILHRFLFHFLRMLLAVSIMALVTALAFWADSVVVDILVALLLCIFTVMMFTGKARLKLSKLFIPLFIGSIVGVSAVAFYTLFLVLGLRNPFNAHIFIPVFGLVAGGIITANAKALSGYYVGLRYHGQLYYYLLGNGASHRQATDYFLRRSLKMAVVTISKNMSLIVLGAAPVMFFTALMCGMGIWQALLLQVVFCGAVLTASLLSLLISFAIGRKYSFDEYERLKPVFKNNNKESQTAKSDSLVTDNNSLTTNQDGQTIAQ